MRPASIAVFAGLLAWPAAAQVVTGRTLDSATREIVPATLISLLNIAGDSLHAMLSDGDGLFRLSVPGAGSYALRAQRLGYADLTTTQFLVRPDEIVTVEVLLGADPIDLEPLAVVGRRSGSGLIAGHRRRADWIDRTGIGKVITRKEFDECLKMAQQLGYAEADPTFDVEGYDAAHKLALLTAISFGTAIDAGSIYVEGISSITPADIEAADELGYRIKLLGVACRTESGIEQRVHPTMVPKSSAIARVDGVTNAVAVEADFVGQLVLSGPGAGGDATASSVMSDIADIARGDRVGTFGRPAVSLEPYRRAAIRLHEGGYYIRLSVFDRPGAFAAIAGRMAEHKISLESIVQRRRAPRSTAPEHPIPDDPQPVILITYETTEDAIRQALDEISRDGHIADAPQMIRIEQFS
jgi:hypothetical protein